MLALATPPLAKDDNRFLKMPDNRLIPPAMLVTLVSRHQIVAVVQSPVMAVVFPDT